MAYLESEPVKGLYSQEAVGLRQLTTLSCLACRKEACPRQHATWGERFQPQPTSQMEDACGETRRQGEDGLPGQQPAYLPDENFFPSKHHGILGMCPQEPETPLSPGWEVRMGDPLNPGRCESARQPLEAQRSSLGEMWPGERGCTPCRGSAVFTGRIICRRPGDKNNRLT